MAVCGMEQTVNASVGKEDFRWQDFIIEIAFSGGVRLLNELFVNKSKLSGLENLKVPKMKQSWVHTILFKLVVATFTLSLISLFVYVIINEPNERRIFVEKTANTIDFLREAGDDFLEFKIIHYSNQVKT